MEESGHYYTVYYTSLAVGFDPELAYQHAVLAQMPDEVGWLDAANMHTREYLHISEYNLWNERENVGETVRFEMERSLHALVDCDSAVYIQSSEEQLHITLELLRKYQADSLEFGLLLHRLGDNYAHRKMGKEWEMYTTTSCGTTRGKFYLVRNMGHFIHMHDPDYWFLRVDLFFEYLSTLYNELLAKLQQSRKTVSPRLSYPDLACNYKSVLAEIDAMPVFRWSNRRGNDEHIRKPSSEEKICKTIEKIREFIVQLGIRDGRRDFTMHEYAPEKKSGQNLNHFMRQHPELKFNGRTLTGTRLEQGIGQIFAEIKRMEAEDLVGGQGIIDPANPQ